MKVVTFENDDLALLFDSYTFVARLQNRNFGFIKNKLTPDKFTLIHLQKNKIQKKKPECRSIRNRPAYQAALQFCQIGVRG